MKTLILSLASFFIFSQAMAGSSLKVEGSCSGKLLDGSDVSYTYYSNFNGCKKVSTAGISFQDGKEGMYTGTRSFTTSSDNYTFNSYKLSFKNSTGNTTGKFIYKDARTGKTKTVTLQCEVRDYEYGDC